MLSNPTSSRAVLLSPECRYPEHGRGEEARHQAQPEAGGQPQPRQRGRARHQGAEVEVVHGLDQRHQAEAERGHGDGGEAGHPAQAVLASYPGIPMTQAGDGDLDTGGRGWLGPGQGQQTSDDEVEDGDHLGGSLQPPAHRPHLLRPPCCPLQ